MKRTEKQFMDAARGLPARTAAKIMGRHTVGTDWRGCSKGHLADAWATGNGSLQLLAALREAVRPEKRKKPTAPIGEPLDIAALDDGDILVVTRDIVNPDADRREHYDWRKLPVIPKGKRLTIRRTRGILTQDDHVAWIELRELDGYQAVLFSPGGAPRSDLARHLQHAVEPQDHRLGDLIRTSRRDDCGADVLGMLLDSGKITLDDVRDALNDKDVEAEDWRAFRRRHAI